MEVVDDKSTSLIIRAGLTPDVLVGEMGVDAVNLSTALFIRLLLQNFFYKHVLVREERVLEGAA